LLRKTPETKDLEKGAPVVAGANSHPKDAAKDCDDCTKIGRAGAFSPKGGWPRQGTSARDTVSILS